MTIKNYVLTARLKKKMNVINFIQVGLGTTKEKKYTKEITIHVKIVSATKIQVLKTSYFTVITLSLLEMFGS